MARRALQSGFGPPVSASPRASARAVSWRAARLVVPHGGLEDRGRAEWAGQRGEGAGSGRIGRGPGPVVRGPGAPVLHGHPEFERAPDDTEDEVQADQVGAAAEPRGSEGEVEAQGVVGRRLGQPHGPAADRGVDPSSVGEDQPEALHGAVLVRPGVLPCPRGATEEAPGVHIAGQVEFDVEIAPPVEPVGGRDGPVRSDGADGRAGGAEPFDEVELPVHVRTLRGSVASRSWG
ncbi:hypothetical protein NS184_10500 [Curtobacterium luteum]|uniref:Uncharacterized protein n=1 Tax=Curtobacterium luteum TaxID=33881 RepID=A0A175RPS1_9MICO|nr:hypothetical protein NS184_10500 [Curtobacterium luteum]